MPVRFTILHGNNIPFVARQCFASSESANSSCELHQNKFLLDEDGKEEIFLRDGLFDKKNNLSNPVVLFESMQFICMYSIAISMPHNKYVKDGVLNIK